MLFFQNLAEIVAQLNPVPAIGNKYKSISFWSSVNIIYSWFEPQFVRVSPILEEEKTTPRWFGLEAVDDFSAGKLSSVAVP